MKADRQATREAAGVHLQMLSHSSAFPPRALTMIEAESVDPVSAPGENVQGSQAIDVLVVDDDSGSVEELVECLVRAELTCRPAFNGWAALQLLADGWQPRIVVTDLRMPELDGMEFVKQLRSFESQERPEIIFVSGHVGFDDAIAAIRLGARDMLTKPVDGPTLVRAVKSALLIRQMHHQADVLLKHRAAAGKALSPVERRRAVLSELRTVRRARSQHLPSELFSDPCWEMLLDLYDAQLKDAEVTVTSLGAASGVPMTTALRRMEMLQRRGLIFRIDDPHDKRRTVMQLTEVGLQAVDNFFASYLESQDS